MEVVDRVLLRGCWVGVVDMVTLAAVWVSGIIMGISFSLLGCVFDGSILVPVTVLLSLFV